jgi:hypothetical protein
MQWKHVAMIVVVLLVMHALYKDRIKTEKAK